MSFTGVTSIQVICGQEVPIADRCDGNDCNCYVPVDCLTSQMRIKEFSGGVNS